ETLDWRMVSAVIRLSMGRTVQHCRFCSWRMRTLENTCALYAIPMGRISLMQ
ncbi:hypothetical protein GCK32_021132, partial [Trichostrongylus colubriformis]